MAIPSDPAARRNARWGQLAAFAGFWLVLAWPTPPDLSVAGQRLAAIGTAMSILWVTQAIPLGVTSLIPLAAFPLLGIQSTEAISRTYLNDSVFLFLGGFIIALGIERWGLHRRIALYVVWLLGSSPKRIVLGFALATGFLSMWISNTAAALLMIPIAMALLKSLEEYGAQSKPVRIEKATLWGPSHFGASLMLAIAYSASIGGVATLIGTPPNLVFRQIFSITFPEAPPVAAGPWMLVFMPMAAIMILIMWGVVTFRMRPIPGTESLGRNFFSEQLQSLGRASTAERRMLVIFALTALLWITRVPISASGEADFGFQVPGWGPWVTRLLIGLGVEPEIAEGMVNDTTVAILMAVALFFIPAGNARPDHIPFDESPEFDPQARFNLMDWKTANRLPWEILLLFGGGFAIASGFTATGLSEWVGMRFAGGLSGQSVWVIVLATSGLLTALTELTSNTVTCNILLPILGPTAVQMGVDPRLVMVAATISASLGFMMPVGTPPNALVFGTGRLTVWEMARAGFLLNLVGVVLVTIFVMVFYAGQLGIDPQILPEWAKGVK